MARPGPRPQIPRSPPHSPKHSLSHPQCPGYPPGPREQHHTLSFAPHTRPALYRPKLGKFLPFSARWPPGAPANPGRPLCAPCRVHTAPVSPPVPHLPELTPHHCFWAKRAETTQIWNFDRSGPKHALRLWFGAPENSGGVCPVHLADSRSIPRCEFCTRHIPVHWGLRRRRRLRPLKKSHTSFSIFFSPQIAHHPPAYALGPSSPAMRASTKRNPAPSSPYRPPNGRYPETTPKTLSDRTRRHRVGSRSNLVVPQPR